MRQSSRIFCQVGYVINRHSCNFHLLFISNCTPPSAEHEFTLSFPLLNTISFPTPSYTSPALSLRLSFLESFLPKWSKMNVFGLHWLVRSLSILMKSSLTDFELVGYKLEHDRFDNCYGVADANAGPVARVSRPKEGRYICSRKV